MLAHLREALRDALPPRVVHAYRVVRHTMLWPSEWEMVVAPRFLSPDAIAIDVGANFGVFTSVLARHSKYVVAFEPNPACALHLAKVMPKNCEVLAKAVSDRGGTMQLRVPVSDGVTMPALGAVEEANRFDTGTDATDFVTHAVETVTLDQVLLAASRPDARVAFINIDAEGHEFAVLKGGVDLIERHRPVLLAELEYRHGAAVEDIFAWLEAMRYVPRALVDGRNLSPVDPGTLRRLQDPERLQRRLAGDRRSGYVNNVFFLPQA